MIEKFDRALKAGEQVAYMENEKVAALVNGGADWQKTALTELRLPRMFETGNDLTTYVKDGAGGVRVETTGKVTEDVVVARNPGQIGTDSMGQPVFNEWLIPKETAVKNYGEETVAGLGSEFSAHRKAATVKAVELTREIIDELGVEGDELKIKVSWSPEPMKAKIGDYLTSGGYSISAHDMGGYEKAGPSAAAPRAEGRKAPSA